MEEMLVSDETLNNHNLKVRTSGGDFTRFNKNPIMLFNHIRIAADTHHPILPIGTWSIPRTEGTNLFATPSFDTEEKFAKKIAGKFKRGIIRSASIGINPLELSVESGENGEDVFVVEKWELMEISICDIPSNQNAVAFYNRAFEPLELNAVINMAVKPTVHKKLPTMNEFEFIPGMLGLSASASRTEIEKKMNELLKAQTLNLALTAENELLKKQVTAIKEQEIITLVDKAVADKKILPAARESYIKLCHADLESAKTLLEGIAVQVKLSDVPIKKITATADNGKMTFEGMTFSEMQRKASGKLIALKANDFKTFNALYKAEFGKDYIV